MATPLIKFLQKISVLLRAGFVSFIFLLFIFFSFPLISLAQCPTCGNGSIDAGETNLNCPQDISMPATCTSPCSQPTSFETTAGIRTSYDFVGNTTYSTSGLPTGWTFAGAPTATTAGALPAADTYGAKAGLVQPNCSGSCTGTNGFCIGNIANSLAVGSGGTNGKLGANFDGRANIAQNLSYAVLRGQSNPTLVSETFNFSAVEGFKLQFWLCASESSCGQTNGWGSCTGNNAYLDFSSNGGTAWTQIMSLNTSSTNIDMCTNNSSNTFWIQEGTWSRVCLTVFKSTASAGNFYPAATATTAASGMMVSSAWFSASFKYRIRYSQTASCTGTVTTTNPGRYLAIDYPVITSGDQMIPCGISFSNMCGYGADNNDDGVGSTATTTTTVFGTVRRSTNQAERGTEIMTSQTAAFASQNLTGSTFATNYDLCNAEGGDKQCIDWRANNNFYNVVYEAVMDFERPNINLQYYKGTTPQSTTLTKVTAAGKTAAIGWRYSGSRFVSCSSLSDLNPGCNGYYFMTPSLPTQFIRGFYHLAINSTGNSWSFYGATSCSHYFNGPFFSPIAIPDSVSDEPDYIVCNPDPVFSGVVNFCSDASGFSGTPTLTFTGPGGFSETINSNETGTMVIVDTGTYTITPNVPSSPAQCLDCARSVCINVTAADLISCAVVLPISLLSFSAELLSDRTHLKWITASETNNDYFIIEKSLDAIVFETVGQIDGAGTSTSQIMYEFDDTEVPFGNVYYRLKQVDHNGHFTFSKIIYVKEEEENFFIFPNPNPGIFKLDPKGFSGSIKIENLLGEIVFEKRITDNEIFQLDVSFLSDGVYFIYNESDRSGSTRKMIIQR
jgi:hypothetical protein